MNPRRLLLSTALALALAAPAARAQSGGGYDLTRASYSGGGLGPVTGGEYSLGGSIGQADAGLLTGGSFELIGGFWGPASLPTTGTGPVADAIPKVFGSRLASANPFHQSVSLAIELPTAQRVSVVVYGVDGRVVRRLADADDHAGRHQVHWDGNDDGGRRVAPGVYFLNLHAGRYVATHRVARLD